MRREMGQGEEQRVCLSERFHEQICLCIAAAKCGESLAKNAHSNQDDEANVPIQLTVR
jgi:hypothetical protein